MPWSLEQGLVLAPEFDTRHSGIFIVRPAQDDDDGDERYVTLVYPVSLLTARTPCHVWTRAARAWAEKSAAGAWQAKYGPSATTIEVLWPETVSAGAIPHEGSIQLAASEMAAIRAMNLEGIDRSLPILWAMVEGFGWRPGAMSAGQRPQWFTYQIRPFMDYSASEDPEGALEIALDLMMRETTCAAGPIAVDE
jgi:hypothetical protein